MKRQNGSTNDTDASPDIRDGELGLALRRAVGSAADIDEASLQAMALRAVAAAGGARVNPAAETGAGNDGRRLHRVIERRPERDPASWRLTFVAAAAAIVVGVGAAGFGVSGYSDARANALQAAQAIMPEYSRWFTEAIDGDDDAASSMTEFVESLWSSGTTADSVAGPFGPVY